MSEEEIIEIVNEIKNHQIDVFEPKENLQITRNYFTEKQRQALQGIIDLYNKEKEKKESYKKDLKLLVEEIDIKYISKDKIREKFKKVKEECEIELVYQIVDLLEKVLLGE